MDVTSPGPTPSGMPEACPMQAASHTCVRWLRSARSLHGEGHHILISSPSLWRRGILRARLYPLALTETLEWYSAPQDGDDRQFIRDLLVCFSG